MLTVTANRIIIRILSLYEKLRGKSFPGSRIYWKRRYKSGRNSGAGSFGRLSRFKAEYLNGFVLHHKIESVVELGCGDGNQLLVSSYPSYFGLDISPEAVGICKKLFSNDGSKEFGCIFPEYRKFDLAVSLDVIYHLIEEDVFVEYMTLLFRSSEKWVIIYSSDMDDAEFYHRFPLEKIAHIKHWRVMDWVRENQPNWVCVAQELNKYPYDLRDTKNTSFANFYVFQRC